jgi:hypothetical protein
MPRIQVQPDELRAAGATAQQVGGHVTGLAGQARAVASGDGAPSATASALQSFGGIWSGNVAHVGDAITALGQTADLAAGLYAVTDANVMPG